MKNILSLILMLMSTSLFALGRDLDIPADFKAENAYIGFESHIKHTRCQGTYPLADSFKHVKFQEQLFGGIITHNNIAFELTGQTHLNKTKPMKNHRTAITGPGLRVIKITQTKYDGLELLTGAGLGHLKCRYFRDTGNHSRKRIIPRGILGAQYMFNDNFGVRGTVLYDHSSMLKIHDLRIKNSVSFGFGVLSIL
jgi:hypothetical protein